MNYSPPLLNAFGGYHAAKPRRAQELMDYQIQKNNLEMLNMLNIKYIIQTDENNQPVALENPDVNGNAWFIKNLWAKTSANAEMQALDSLKTKEEAFFRKNGETPFKDSIDFSVDSTATITLKEVEPNYLEYESNNPNDGFAVFSENYYGKGWQAYIDGEAVEHYRVNYLLRGLPIPAGNRKVEFKFEPKVVALGSQLSLMSSVLVGLLIIGGLYYEFRKKTKDAGRKT